MTVTGPKAAQGRTQDDAKRDASIDGDQFRESLSKAQYVFPLPPSTPPAMGAGFAPSTGSTTITFHHHDSPNIPPPPPHTPPPFSDFVLYSPPIRTSASKGKPPSDATVDVSDTQNNPVEFHTRRKRAAKLSQFFGVEMNTMAEVLPAVPRQSSPSSGTGHARKSSEHRRKLSSDESVPPLPPLVMVNGAPMDANVADAPKVRILHGDKDREMDLNDAIDKLRRMKSV